MPATNLAEIFQTLSQHEVGIVFLITRNENNFLSFGLSVIIKFKQVSSKKLSYTMEMRAAHVQSLHAKITAQQSHT
jgi:hypothetical protein